MNKKIKITIDGVELQVSEKFVNGNKVDMNHVAAANVVKQFVKARYPEVCVSTKSDSFSMGNSVDVYLSNKMGQPVDREIVKTVQHFGDQFVYGKFDGMTDMYEYNGSKLAAGEYMLDPGVKYLSVQNRAQHGSLPDTVRMLVEMTTTNNYVFGKLDMDKAISQATRFGASMTNIQKAMAIYPEAVRSFEESVNS